MAPVRPILVLLLAAGVQACGAETTAPLPDAPARDIEPGPYVPGQSYFGRNGYIEYIAGNSPVILSAPHGGDLTPSEIPDRTAGACGGAATTTRDLNTRELVIAMRQAHHARFGSYPHVVINHLHRRKLDANREIVEAACGDAEAETAWHEFHDYIGVAKDAVLQADGRGWYMDMHGHGHEIQRLELGWLLSGTQLRLSDATLDGDPAYENLSSLATLSRYTAASFSAVVRGPTSLGSLYAANGFPSVPSPGDPWPESGEPYFSGGYDTERHACGVEAANHGGSPGGGICGVQIEANYTGVRDNAASRQAFAEATATALDTFLETHWDLDLGGGTPPAITLQAAGRKVKGVHHVDLTWSGAQSGSVDVRRGGVVIVTTTNDGIHTDNTGAKGSATYTYAVCEAGTSTCSPTVTVVF